MLFSVKYLVQVVFSLAFSSAVQARSLNVRASTCNGHAELCSRGYGNITFVGAHDSYAVGTGNVFVNQDYDLTQQLNDGVRMLQMQAHNQSGTIQLCHTSCALYNGGTLSDYLTKVKTWMDSNTNDVVTLLIVNIDNLLPSAYDTVFKAVGLDTISYTPTSSALPASGWPTLGSMIDGGTRLVTFLDNGADFATVPYLIDEFTNMWETAYDLTDPSTFDCNVNRSKGDTTTQMYLINHFLDKLVLGQPAPNVDQANVTNSASGAGSLGAQVDTCVATNTRSPNFMLVDFYEYGGGSVFTVAANANGVTYSPSTPIATPITSASSSSPSSSSSGSSNAGTTLESHWQWLSMISLVIGTILLRVV